MYALVLWIRIRIDPHGFDFPGSGTVSRSREIDKNSTNNLISRLLFLRRYVLWPITYIKYKWDSQWMEIWSNHLRPSMGPDGWSVAMDWGKGGWWNWFLRRAWQEVWWHHTSAQPREPVLASPPHPSPGPPKSKIISFLQQISVSVL